MRLSDFYMKCYVSEKDCVEYLTKLDINLAEEAVTCSKCSAEMKKTTRKNRKGEHYPTFKCPRKGCGTYKSMRTKAFFSLNDGCSSKLEVRGILEIVFMWILKFPTLQIADLTGCSTRTVVKWLKRCRKVCTAAVSVESQGKLIEQ